MLPINVLNDLVRSYTSHAQSMVPDFLANTFEMLRSGQTQMMENMAKANPLSGMPGMEAMQAQQAQIRDLEAQLNLAKIDLGRFEQLAEKGAIAQQQLDSQRAQVARLSQQLAAAEAPLTQLAVTRRANVGNASAQVNAAEADL